jgi:hypothetical protein
MTTGTLIAGPLAKIGRAALAQIPVPPGTSTHKPIPHHEIVEALVETLGFRHIGVIEEEYAISADGMKMFGVLDLETQMEGCRLNADSRIMPTTKPADGTGRSAGRHLNRHNQRPSRNTRS